MTTSVKSPYRKFADLHRSVQNRSMLVPGIIFAAVALMALYAALRPEQYTRYFLTEWQRERISGNLRGLSLTGWGIFVFCVVVAIGFGWRTAIRPYSTPLEAGMLLIFALAWLWWGIDLLLRPESFIKRANARWPRWLVKAFGLILLLGAVGFAYEFGVKAKVLFR
jgi:hypothetical protein